MFHLCLLRDQIHFTQAEMAAELGINVSTYAMMERGDRKVLRKLYPLVDQLAGRFDIISQQVKPIKAPESPAIAELRDTYEKQSAIDIEMEGIRYNIQIYKLEKELKKMKQDFDIAPEVVNDADGGLPCLKAHPELQYAYAALYMKSKKAMATMERITRKKPRKIAMQIMALKQQRSLLESAKDKGPEYWLEFKI
jgi:transcriptional regulator with XRE-family HTH domain